MSKKPKKRQKAALPSKARELIKLDVGCGSNKREGFVGIDIAGGADIVHDLTNFPWPIADASVGEVHCSHVFEHIPGKLRGKFMDELWRVMAPGAGAVIIVPAYNSSRAVQDFTHEWPPICPASFYYFNKPWREINKLIHGAYDLVCDFSMEGPRGGQINGSVDPNWAQRELSVQQFAANHYLNVVMDFTALLVKPKDVEGGT